MTITTTQPHPGRRHLRRGRRADLHRRPDPAPADERRLGHYQRLVGAQHRQGGHGGAGAGGHHRSVPASGPPDPRAGADRLLGVRRRIPPHAQHRGHRARSSSPDWRTRRPATSTTWLSLPSVARLPTASAAWGPSSSSLASGIWLVAYSSVSHSLGPASCLGGRRRSSPWPPSPPWRSRCCRSPSTARWLFRWVWPSSASGSPCGVTSAPPPPRLHPRSAAWSMRQPSEAGFASNLILSQLPNHRGKVNEKRSPNTPAHVGHRSSPYRRALHRRRGLRSQGYRPNRHDNGDCIQGAADSGDHSTQLYVSGSLSELALGAVAVSYAAIAMLIRKPGATAATVAAV